MGEQGWNVDVLSSADGLWLIERYEITSPVKAGWAVSEWHLDRWEMLRSGLESLEAAKAWVNEQSGGGQDGL